MNAADLENVTNTRDGITFGPRLVDGIGSGGNQLSFAVGAHMIFTSEVLALPLG